MAQRFFKRLRERLKGPVDGVLYRAPDGQYYGGSAYILQPSLNPKTPTAPALRMDLPQQLLATPLVWYWNFKGPAVHRLTADTMQHLLADLQEDYERRKQHTTWFALYGLERPLQAEETINVQEIGMLVYGGGNPLVGALRVYIHQLGDYRFEVVCVSTDALPVLEELLRAWDVTLRGPFWEGLD
jgi:hypothetical protein